MESFLAKLSIMLAPALLAITSHEVAHGFVADHFGDPTARLSGRLSLNPLRHLDPIGTLTLFVFGFGWARPVPVLFANLRHPRRDMIWVSLAGPGANFALAIVCALSLHLLAWVLPDQSSLAYTRFYEPLALMLGFGLYINLLLGLFNLMPIPPLDGGRVLIGLLPTRFAQPLARLEPFGFLFVLLLIFFTDLWGKVLSPLVVVVLQALSGKQMIMVEQAIHFLFGH